MTFQTGHLLLASWHEFETLRGRESVARFVASELAISLEEAAERVADLGEEVVAIRLRPRYRLDPPRRADGPAPRALGETRPTRASAQRGTPRPPQTEAEAVLAIRLVTDDGVALPDVQLEIGHGDAWQSVTTNEAGIATQPLPEGPYEVRFAETPVGVPAVPDTTVAVRPDVLLERGRSAPFTMSARPIGAEPRTVVVRRPVCTEVLIDGYAMGSVVLRWGGTRERSEAEEQVVGTARGALRTALWLARSKRIVVVGHTDPAGSDGTNAEIAAERAASVYLYASGRLDEWAQHAAAHGNDIDRACAAIACARILGHAVPAFENDGALRRALDDARQATGEASGSDAVGDYRAAAKLYDVDLARIFRSSVAELATLRSSVQWHDGGHAEVGERFPRSAAELDPVSAAGLPYALACRRTALVVLAELDAEALVDMNDFYDGTFRRTTIDAPSEARFRLQCVDPAKRARAGARVWLGTEIGVHPYEADGAGLISCDALRGERIEVVLGTDAGGSGTVLGAGTSP